ncbi:MAG: Zn-binding domain-containing protein [Spirochaetota bacterium]
MASSSTSGSSAFPWNFFEYVATHGEALQKAFLSRFGEDELDAYSRKYLGELLQAGNEGPELTREVLERLGGLREEIQSLKRRLQTISTSLHEFEQKPHLDSTAEERRDDLKRQQRALEVIISRLQKKNTFQFLTDEGLIPNFSFPEAGVVLRSVILRRSKRNTEVGEPQIYEYQRPAMAALSELAPEAEFYGQGRKVTIQQIDLRTSEIEQWRICDTCHHMEPEVTGAQYTTCPRCASPQWSDVGRRQNLLKMKQVVAVEPDWKSRIYDEKEERTPTFFSRNLFVDVDPREITEAQVMDAASLPFGFEFVRNVTLRDLNFGRMNSSRNSFNFGGMEVSAGGFHICRHCGAVLTSGHSEESGSGGFGSTTQHGEVNHAAWCPVNNGEADEGDAFSAVFLYRDYQSEAIRLLIPTELFAVERQLESFVAGLFLGLRQHFGGSVDHIRSTHMYLPGAEGGPKEHFLVLYDSVPGGTGYLKQLLADSDSPTGTGTMRAVFEHALRFMQSCPCEDGCHRCVYSYRQAHVMERISKQTAIALFTRIIDNWHTLSDAHGAVAGHSGNAWLESRLEATFVQALHAIPEALGFPVALHGAQVRGKAGWTLTVNGNTYQVEPQPRVGFTDSVTPASTPDFMIRPAGEHGLSRPIAVFTDGFAFHADIERGPLSVGADAHKRIAIHESGRYWVWSLTYDDVATALMPDTTSEAAGAFLVDPNKFERACALVKNREVVKLAKQGSLHALIGLLAYPDERTWKRMSAAAGVALSSNGSSLKLSRGLGERAWVTADLSETFAEGRTVETNQDPEIILRTLYPGEPSRGAPGDGPGGPPRWIAAGAVWPNGDLQQELENPEHMRGIVTLRDDDASAGRNEFKGAWNAFWNAVNLLQFLPEIRWSTTSIAPVLDTRWGRRPGDEHAALSAVLELIPDADVRELVRRLDHAGAPLPEPGYELVDAEGAVTAEAELAWEQVRVVLVVDEADGEAFKAAGWTVFELAPDSGSSASSGSESDSESILDKLKGALS